MANDELPQHYHDRASSSSFEARRQAMTLSAAGIAGLFALLTSEGFTAGLLHKVLIILSGVFLAVSIGCGVFNSYADAQWSFYRAKLVDDTPPDGSKLLERKWHRRKGISEYSTQIAFVTGVALAAILLISMVMRLPSH